MKGRVIKAAITVFWLATMAALVIGQQTQAGPTKEPPRHLFEEQWAGIYMKGEKVGYANSLLTKSEDGYNEAENALIVMKVAGEPKSIEMRLSASLDDRFRLRSFGFEMASDVDMEIKGNVQGRELLISLQAAGMTSEKIIPMDEAPFVSFAPAIFMEDLAAGRKLRLPLIEASSLVTDYIEIEAAGREAITVMGRERDTLKLRGAFKGAEVFYWVSDDGEILRQESMGMTFVKETKEDALRLDMPSIDMIADMAVPFDMELPPGVKHLKVRLSGVDLGALDLDGGFQRLEGDVLEINSALPKVDGGSPDTAGMEKYLEETTFIETRNPAIAELSSDIASGGKDTVSKARLIHKWVYGNIIKSPTISIPRSTAVLETRQGDCNEHTTLFTALARASGIPTRMAVGLVYQGGSFYYHAWPEIYASGGWFALDPTLGQWPADASHIRLLAGGIEDQFKLSSVIGKIRIEGIEYR